MKLYSKETFKTREEWLENRAIGGSSASAIVGFNPWMNALELYNSIVNLKDKTKDFQNDSMVYGTESEPLIRKQFALDFPNYKVHSPKNNEMYRRTDKPYLSATLDGILVEKDTKRKGILEIKTHDIRNSLDDNYWKNSIPKNYFIQIIHYLVVMTDFEFVDLVAKLRFFDYFSENGKKLSKTEFRYYHIEKNDEEIKKWCEFLEKKETEFFENNIKNKIPPMVEISFK